MPSTPTAPGTTPSGLPENKGIRFNIKTGSANYTCTLQDRSAYERLKAARTSSTDSAASGSSSSASSVHKH